MGIWIPSNTWFLGPTRVFNSTETASRSVDLFSGFCRAHYCDRPTDRLQTTPLTTPHTPSVTAGRIYARSTAMRPNKQWIRKHNEAFLQFRVLSALGLSDYCCIIWENIPQSSDSYYCTFAISRRIIFFCLRGNKNVNMQAYDPENVTLFFIYTSQRR